MAKTQSPKSAEEKPKKVRRKAVSKPVNSGVEPKRPVGRPTDYSEEIAEKICLLLAEGKSLRSVCDEDGMPDKSTVFRWLYKNEQFRDRYAYAKEIGCYAVEEEAVEIADDGTNDWMEKFSRGQSVGWELNGEHVQRSKLRIETRKWFMERIAAKRYGNKVDVNHGVQPNNPIVELLKQVSGTGLPIKKDGGDE